MRRPSWDVVIMPKFEAVKLVTGFPHRTKLNGFVKSAPICMLALSRKRLNLLLMEPDSADVPGPDNQLSVRAVLPKAYVAGLAKAAGLM